MPYLTAAVLIVGMLCLLNLVLTVGVIHRLRAGTGSTSVDEDGRDLVPQPGDPVADFAAWTVDGGRVSQSSVAGALVAFLSPNCKPCQAALPEVLRRAGSPGAAEVLAVVVGDPQDMTDMVTALGPVARVLTEEPFGPVATAFGVRSFPTFVRVAGDRTIAAAGLDLAQVAGAKTPRRPAVRVPVR
jgi:hypothetical protein